MRHKRWALILAILLACGTIAGCGGETVPDTEAGTSQKDAAVSAEAIEAGSETEADPLKALGDFDFGGRTFRIVACEGFFFSPYAVEEENGDVLNDAAYQRNRAMEENYEIVMEYNMLPGSYTEATNAIITSVTAGDHDYSIGIVHPYGGLTNLIAGGYTYDWNQLPYVDFTKEWWNQSFNKELTIGEILPCASNDFIYFNSGSIYFNKGILNNYGLENPYELVYNGTWTWDKLSEMARVAASDLNGDGVMDDNDQYGYSIINSHRMIPVSYSCGIITSSLNEEGYPVLDNMASEKMVDIVNMYYSLLYENEGTWLASSDELKPFSEGRVLFLHYVTQNIKALRELEFEFGILPQPKYDEQQENYYSLAQSNVMVIPSNVEDTEFAGVISEALAIYSNQYVLPALYENTFNYKYLRDEDSIAMFDIIKNSLVYDKLWNYAEGNATVYFLSNLMGSGSTDLISFYQKNHKAAEKIMADFYDKVLKE